MAMLFAARYSSSRTGQPAAQRSTWGEALVRAQPVPLSPVCGDRHARPALSLLRSKAASSLFLTDHFRPGGLGAGCEHCSVTSHTLTAWGVALSADPAQVDLLAACRCTRKGPGGLTQHILVI